MARSLSVRSRPKTFADVFGQDAIKRILVNDIARDEPKHIILTGPSGTGKTTLALLHASALLCQQPSSAGASCRMCAACLALAEKGNRDLRRVNCPEHGNKEDIEYFLTNFLEYSPLISRYRVLWFDEARSLSLPAQEMLLETLERERSEAICIFTLISAEALIVPLQDRARKFELEVPDMQKSLAYLTHLVRQEGVDADQDALKLIATFCRGYRKLAEELDKAIDHSIGKRLTLPLVRELYRDRSQALLEFLGHCATGNVGALCDSLGAMNVAPPAKLGEIVEVLKHLSVRYIGPKRSSRSDHRLSLLLSEQECRQVVGQLSARAAELGRTPHGLFDEMLEFWLSVPSDVDDNRLEGHALRFHQLMMFSTARPEIPNSAALATRPQIRSASAGAAKWRMRDHTGLVDRRGDFLALVQAQDTYEAATFLAQVHGRPLNARLTVDHTALPVATDEACAERLSNCLRQLRQSLFVSDAKRYGPSADLHRIVFHERGPTGALRSTVLLHLPPDLEAKVRTRLTGWSTRLGNADAIDFQSLPTENGPAAMARHWKLMRELWGGLDPDCTMDGMPVLDILEVPQSLRRQMGRITCRRFNVSQSIGDQARGEAVQQRMAYLSVWSDREWKRLFTGWELREHKDRLAEIQRRQGRLAEIRRSYSTSDLALNRSALEAALANEETSWPVHPHDRERSWRVWW